MRVVTYIINPLANPCGMAKQWLQQQADGTPIPDSSAEWAREQRARHQRFECACPLNPDPLDL